MAWDQHTRPASDYLDPHKQRRILAAHGRICHICGHGNAEQVDHVIPWAEWTRTDTSVHDQTNLRPIHGLACPTCGRTCHMDKTKRESARGRARSAAKRRAAATRPPERHPGDLTTPHAATPNQDIGGGTPHPLGSPGEAG